MRCNPKKVTQHVLGIPDEVEAKTIEEHVASCPSCAQRLAQLRQAVALLEEVPEAENEPVDVAQLRAALASHKPTADRFAWIGGQAVPRWGWAVGLAAAACLLVLFLHYGVAVRVGQFEVAFGAQEIAAPVPGQSAAADEILMRQIARQEIAREVVPTLGGLAQQISDLDLRQREAMVNLRNDIARQRAWDQGEVRRNIQFIAESMSEAVRQHP